MRRPISETKNALIKKVSALATRGMTALGPGVLASIAMASKGALGSQVIILTDGMANIGLGQFGGGSFYGEEVDDSDAIETY